MGYLKKIDSFFCKIQLNPQTHFFEKIKGKEDSPFKSPG